VTEPVLAALDADGERVYRSPLGTFPSVSRILDEVSRPALDNWKRRAVAEAMSRSPELIRLAATDLAFNQAAADSFGPTRP
jgi:hypothetical protein